MIPVDTPEAAAFLVEAYVRELLPVIVYQRYSLYYYYSGLVAEAGKPRACLCHRHYGRAFLSEKHTRFGEVRCYNICGINKLLHPADKLGSISAVGLSVVAHYRIHYFK